MQHQRLSPCTLPHPHPNTQQVACSTNVSKRRGPPQAARLCTCARRRACQRTDGMCRQTTGPHPSPGHVRTCMHLRGACMQRQQAYTWAIASIALNGRRRGIWTASLLTVPPSLLERSIRPRSRAHRCMHGCTNACMYECMHARMHACTNACMYECMHAQHAPTRVQQVSSHTTAKPPPRPHTAHDAALATSNAAAG